MANKKKKKVVKSKKINKKKKKNTKKKVTTNKVSAAKVSSSKESNAKAQKVKVNDGKKKKNSVSKKSNVKKDVFSVKKKSVAKVDENKKNIVINVEEEKIDNEGYNFNKKGFIYLIIFLFLILIISFCIMFFRKPSEENVEFIDIDLEGYMSLYKVDTLEFIYLYHNSCINCKQYEANLRKLEEEFDITIKKFDYSKLSDKEMENLKLSNSALEDGIKIPMILSIKGDEEIRSLSGIREFSSLKNFVNASINSDDIKSFNKIYVDDYLDLLGSKDKSFIYICNPNSSGCKSFSKVLETVSTKKKLKVYYLNTDTINTEEDWKKLEDSNKIFKKVWFMPAVLVVKNNKVVDYKMETLSEKDLTKFIDKNKL